MKLKKYGTLMVYDGMGVPHLEEFISTWRNIKRIIPRELLDTVETRIEAGDFFDGCFVHVWAEEPLTDEEWLGAVAEKELRNREQKTIEYYRLKRELGL